MSAGVGRFLRKVAAMHGRGEVTKFVLTRVTRQPNLPPQDSEEEDKTDTRRRAPMKVKTKIKAGLAVSGMDVTLTK